MGYRFTEEEIKGLFAEIDRLRAATPERFYEIEAWCNQQKKEIERLRLGLKMIVAMEYDAGYEPEDFAAAVLSGDEPQRS